MKTAAIICILLLSSCYTKQKAQKQFGRAAVTYPEVAADYCGRVYPPKDTFINGQVIYKIDTLYSDGEVLILSDTVVIRDTVFITKVKKIPTVIRETVFKTDTIIKENNAATEAATIQLNSALQRLAERTAELKSWKFTAKKRFWGMIGLLAVLLFVAYLLTRKMNKK